MQIADFDTEGPYVPLLLRRQLGDTGLEVYDIVVVAGEAASVYRQTLSLEDVICYILRLWRDTETFIRCNDSRKILRVSDFIALPTEFLHRHGIHLVSLPDYAVCTLNTNNFLECPVTK